MFLMNNINKINISRILRLIWFSDGISRAEIARKLHLVKSTVTIIVGMLIERGLVKSLDESRNEGGLGRKPTHLEIDKDFGYVLGIEIQTESYNAVAVNLLGDVLFSISEPLSGDGMSVVDRVAAIVTRCKEKMPKTSLDLIGVGVGIAGIINPFEGIIYQSNPLDIRSPVNFHLEMEKRLKVPVLLENDANCCCWGELASRKTERHDNFIFVLGEFRKGRTQDSGYWGIAVGIGLVFNGKVYYGSNFSAGEFQSILWESSNSGQFSITDTESRRIREDPAVRTRVVRELCSHVSFLINTLNLSNVIIGGEIAEYRDEIMETLRQEIQKNWSYPNQVECTIDFAGLKELAVAYGAAGVFLESMFGIPEVGTPSFPIPQPWEINNAEK